MEPENRVGVLRCAEVNHRHHQKALAKVVMARVEVQKVYLQLGHMNQGVVMNEGICQLYIVRIGVKTNN